MVDAPDVGRLFADTDAFDRATARLWGPVSQGTVDLSRPRPGDRVLDACCGAGASALIAGRAVGPTGHVDAVDLAPGLLALGEHRAHEAGVSWLSYHHADVTTFGRPGSYDLVLCVLGIFFLPDMDAGMRHLVALGGPGGRVAVTTWASGSLSTLLPVLGRAAASERPPPSGPGSHTSSARVQDPAGLSAVLTAAGLVEVDVQRVPLTVALDTELALALLDGSAARILVDGLDPAALGRVRQRVGPLLAEQGATSVDASFLVGTGQVPRP